MGLLISTVIKNLTLLNKITTLFSFFSKGSAETEEGHTKAYFMLWTTKRIIYVVHSTWMTSSLIQSAAQPLILYSTCNPKMVTIVSCRIQNKLSFTSGHEAAWKKINVLTRFKVNKIQLVLWVDKSTKMINDVEKCG